MMEKLWVIYDSRCGFCVSCRAWLERQPAYLPLEFLPARSEATASLFPGLERPDAPEELTVVSDEGEVWRGSKAWLLCLWALAEYREWAERLSSPALLPLTREFFEFVSRNRAGISRRLGLLSEQELVERLSQVSSPACGTGTSAFPLAAEASPGGLRARTLLLLAVLVWALAALFAAHKQTFLTWSADRGLLRVVAVLDRAGADGGEALRRAASDGNTSRARRLLASGVEADGKDRYGRTALMEAARAGRNDIVLLLLERGADPNEADGIGKTVAVHAAEGGHLRLVKQLRNAGANLEARDINRNTALIEAAGTGKTKVVELLIRAGADVNAKGYERGSALGTLAAHCSEPNSFSEVAELLIAAGADVNAKDLQGKTPLAILAGRNKPELFPTLITARADVNMPDEEGKTLLMTADRDSVRALLVAGANVDAQDEEGRTALMHAIFKGEDSVALALIEAGADVNLMDRKGATALDFFHKYSGTEHLRVKLRDAGARSSENKP